MIVSQEKNALISVSNKDGVAIFASALETLGFNLVSTGGTASCLEDANIPVTQVSTVTGFLEILGGRVKTLHPKIFGGILPRASVPKDDLELARHKIKFYSIVCVNLYPFTQTVAKPNVTLEEAIENIDIGGASLLRAAAKNFQSGVTAICDPADYDRVIKELQENDSVSNELRAELAVKAFKHTMRYDAAIWQYLSEHNGQRVIALFGREVGKLKYGENPWQEDAGFFTTDSGDPLGIDQFKSVSGDLPSYNNINDLSRLLNTITHIAATFDLNRGRVPCIAVACKHGNPCGAAVGDDPEEVIIKMVEGDMIAIFGGLVVTNFPLDEPLVTRLRTHRMPEKDKKRVLDGVFMPKIDPEAIKILERKHGKCRMMTNPVLGQLNLDVARHIRYVRGGFLAQPNYTFVLDLNHPQMERFGPPATRQQENDILLACSVGSTSISNTVTIVKDLEVRGNGVGRMDRVGSSFLALHCSERGKHNIKGGAGYSDSFFPFPDGPQLLVDAGIKAVFTSSGSVNDEAVKKCFIDGGVSLLMLPDKVCRGFMH